MALGGAVLRSLLTITLFLAFLTSAIILGIMSYFLSSLSTHHRTISSKLRAIEGISGAAVLYSLIATLTACCLGGIAGFAYISAILDALFIGGMVAIVILVRGSATSHCSGPNVSSFLGSGAASDHVYGGNKGASGTQVGIACNLQKAIFGSAIAGICLFFLALICQMLLRAHQRREKAFGPSPANNYTSGRPSRNFFGRRKHRNILPTPADDTTATHNHRDAELGILAAGVAGAAVAEKHHHSHLHNNRHSAEMGYTGSTVNPSPTGYNAGLGGDKYEYPVASGANPYARSTTPTMSSASGYAGDRTSYPTQDRTPGTGGVGYSHPSTTLGGYGSEYGHSGVPAERGHAFTGPGGTYAEGREGANF